MVKNDQLHHIKIMSSYFGEKWPIASIKKNGAIILVKKWSIPPRKNNGGFILPKNDQSHHAKKSWVDDFENQCPQKHSLIKGVFLGGFGGIQVFFMLGDKIPPTCFGGIFLLVIVIIPPSMGYYFPKNGTIPP